MGIKVERNIERGEFTYDSLRGLFIMYMHTLPLIHGINSFCSLTRAAFNGFRILAPPPAFITLENNDGAPVSL